MQGRATLATMEKPYATSCDKNREPILAVLEAYFHDRRAVLEIGSGTGQHAVFFAARLPHLIWQTSDRAENLPGITAWLDEAALPNTPPPLRFDVQETWPALRYDALFSANTLHIMHWAAVESLFASLAGIMARDAKLAIYGPFNYGGQFTSDSNAAFDESLRRRDPASGIRDHEAVDVLARAAGLEPLADHAMPANNRLLVWVRAP